MQYFVYSFINSKELSCVCVWMCLSMCVFFVVCVFRLGSIEHLVPINSRVCFVYESG